MQEVRKFERQVQPPAAAGALGARKALARIAATWPERDLAEPGLARIAVADAELVLSPIPADALQRAVTRFIAGEIGDPRFPPRVPEIAAEARRIAARDAEIAARSRPSPRQLPRAPISPVECERRKAITARTRQMLADAALAAAVHN